MRLRITSEITVVASPDEMGELIEEVEELLRPALSEVGVVESITAIPIYDTDVLDDAEDFADIQQPALARPWTSRGVEARQTALDEDVDGLLASAFSMEGI